MKCVVEKDDQYIIFDTSKKEWNELIEKAKLYDEKSKTKH